MNYLAHIYLSESKEKVTIGNFIADGNGITGKSYKKFPKAIQVGILLHRQIDTFTDAHPIVKQSTKRLHKNYGHYSGIIVDIFYDHFLAKNWSKYSEISLEDEAQWFYTLLQNNFDTLPERTQYLLPYMVKANWLVSYSNIKGIEDVLVGMDKRTKNLSHMHLATKELRMYYDEFEAEFTTFFEELRTFSHHKLNSLLDTI
ncbi:acyl carrier protein phosphodiesterase [Formosa agariphila KMM 3901]|uniref:Acyl carrier protein phosphodiesterase n=1 Tax=Formosa agariphila (strain DSM 15362 / KCTC 12365 / LMG 23005 / KMM 3901 / M-2Alg 35-1) TaxID=1347342 RepID=T2KL88_FORAG|nr:acyl carrier protein phosphodiesterase [Formosa agariphila]CDF79662.1 acyl carrier protein phosphodiesterase [Formosa agariphila KMM 3901]